MNKHMKRTLYCILALFSVAQGMGDNKNNPLLPDPFAEQFFKAADKGNLKEVKAAFEALNDQQRLEVLTERCGPGQLIHFKGYVKFTGIEFLCAMSDVPVLMYILQNLPGNEEGKKDLTRHFQ